MNRIVLLLCTPHWCVLSVGLLAAVGLRLTLGDMGPGVGSTGTFAGFLAANALVYGLIGAFFVLVERRSRGLVSELGLSIVTFLVVLGWLLDLGSLLTIGTPLQYSHVALVASEPRLLAGIAHAELGTGPTGLILSSPLIFLALSAGFGRRRRSLSKERGDRISVIFPGVVTIAAALLTLSGGFAPHVTLSENVHFRLLGQALTAEDGASLPSEVFEPTLADPTGEHRDLPGIVVVVLESTGADAVQASSLGDGMPQLRGWNGPGTVFTQLRTTIPHTSKALVSILCGVYPARNSHLVESSDNYPLTCLPHILRSYGYRTLFVQSADGTYERRPGLVDRMGFDSFLGPQDREEWERLGYFNGDEAPMIEQVDRWIDSGDDPFLVVVLTSLTHHPYHAPSEWEDAESINAGDRPQRHAALVTKADAFLAELAETLGVFDRPDRLFMVLGDHGEQVASEGLRFHNNVWFERVLQVPLFLSGPNVATEDFVDQPGSIIDLTPTILDSLNIPIPPGLDGVSLLSGDAIERPLFSASWLPDQWTSVTWGRFKLVRWSESGRSSLFDLTAPNQEEPLLGSEHPELRELVMDLDEAVQRWERAHIIDLESAAYRPRLLFDGAWGCEPEGCWYTATGAGIPSHSVNFGE